MAGGDGPDRTSIAPFPEHIDAGESQQELQEDKHHNPPLASPPKQYQFEIRGGFQQSNQLSPCALANAGQVVGIAPVTGPPPRERKSKHALPMRCARPGA